MRLGFHFHIPAVVQNDRIKCPGFLGCFLDSLAAFCDQVVYFAHSPRPDERSLMDYTLRSSNILLVDIGPHHSAIRRTLFSGRYTRPLVQWRSRLDALLIRGPSPLLPEMAAAAGSLPTALLLVGDYVAGINDLRQPPWRKELIRLWIFWNRFRQDRIARKSLTFVNSRKLFNELRSKAPNLVETRTTTLNKKDIYKNYNSRISRPVRLLYTGRLSASKGLFDVIDAMAILASRNLDTRLDLVGWPEKREENLVERLQHFARNKGLAGNVEYHGFKPVGPALFTFYRRADIYIAASQSSEGFPRTIWEAMSQSLPVIATRVGSIPDFIEGASELVDPNDPAGLAEAIWKMIHSPDTRREYVIKGIQMAEQNTLEIQVGEMARKIREWLEVSS